MADWKSDLAKMLHDKQQTDKTAAEQGKKIHNESGAAMERAVRPALEEFADELRKAHAKQCNVLVTIDHMTARIEIRGGGNHDPELDLTIQVSGASLEQIVRTCGGTKREKGFQPRRADKSTPTIAEMTKEDVLRSLVSIYRDSV